MAPTFDHFSIRYHLLTFPHPTLEWPNRNHQFHNLARGYDSSYKLLDIEFFIKSPGEGPPGPSKSELKKQAKEAEKQKRAAEKAAKQEELARQKEAANVVRNLTMKLFDW
jgi:hypothetical protein